MRCSSLEGGHALLTTRHPGCSFPSTIKTNLIADSEVVNHHVGTRNWPQVLCKNFNAAHLPQHYFVFKGFSGSLNFFSLHTDLCWYLYVSASDPQSCLSSHSGDWTFGFMCAKYVLNPQVTALKLMYWFLHWNGFFLYIFRESLFLS